MLEIGVGRVISTDVALGSPTPSYFITADFGKFGVRTSVGRFTHYSTNEMLGKQILGVLNFEPREIGGVISEFLCLGVQYPKADRGDATIITQPAPAKIGGKLFQEN